VPEAVTTAFVDFAFRTTLVLTTTQHTSNKLHEYQYEHDPPDATHNGSPSTLDHAYRRKTAHALSSRTSTHGFPLRFGLCANTNTNKRHHAFVTARRRYNTSPVQPVQETDSLVESEPLVDANNEYE
jgi:hypothetical protein